MAELSPIPFVDLVRRMRREVEVSGAIFDLPVKKWWMPEPGVDFGAVHFERRAATPLGPAAGPQTQLAQNIVLAWLAGSRIVELKTVQVNDRLTIPRPCIHAPNVGYNVEWSQELRLAESQREYAKAVYLIEILKATRGFGAFPDDVPASAFDTIYDLSVGYDLDGIRTAAINGFVYGMRNPERLFDELRRELPAELGELRDVELPAEISGCVTLSTFHGCPADQIEAIAEFLITVLHLDTVVKLNPTLLGFDTVHELLIERLGYRHLALRRDAFDCDLRYDQALEIFDRLRTFAVRSGTEIGAKFTNTLVVANDPAVFPTQGDPYMYLSGPPLHVLSMTLMQRFRDDFGAELPISFSAGVDARNFAATVACGLVPVTTCTDLLRQGGYGRLPGYLKALGKAMAERGVTSREAYVLAAQGHGVEAALATLETFPDGADVDRRAPALLRQTLATEPDRLPAVLRQVADEARLDTDALLRDTLRAAGRMNGRAIVAALADEARYHAAQNAREPRRIDSVLELYDCINCDLCIAACPNDAVFAWTATPVATATEELRGTAGGDALTRAAGAGFKIGEAHQLAVFEGACNECSNCEVYCPEIGAPFRVKERVFGSRTAFDASAEDGFCRDGGALLARLDGRELRLDPALGDNRAAVSGDGFRLELSWQPFAVVGGYLASREQVLDTARLWRMKTAWESIFHAAAPNPVTGAPAA